MTPIERAASKIREGLSIIDEDTRLAELTDTEVEWLAKVAMVAMREPSEAMIIDGKEYVQDGSARACWYAMIDAALGEG